MMKYVAWHYSKGLSQLLAMWKVLNVYIFEYFSVRDLAKTLFAPWHRDVSHKIAPGFRPLLSIQLFAENLMSRVLGGIVRVLTIFFSFFLFLMLQVVLVVTLLAWMALPLDVLFMLLLPMVGYALMGMLLLAGAAIAIILALKMYRVSVPMPREDLTFHQQILEPWFGRVLGRLGVMPSDIDRSVIESEDAFRTFLLGRNVSWDDYRYILEWERNTYRLSIVSKQFWRKEFYAQFEPVGRQWKYSYIPTLERYAYNMVDVARRRLYSGRVYVREKEYTKMLLALERPGRNSVFLIAEPGSGKQSIVERFAQEISRERVSEIFTDHRIMHLDLAAALTSRKGSPVENAEKLLAEATFGGNVILYIESIDQFLGVVARENSYPDLAPLFEKYLNHPDLRLIATTTSKLFHERIERLTGLSKYIEVLTLEPMSEEQSETVVMSELSLLENRHILFTLEAIRKIVLHSAQANPYLPLPERAVDLVEQMLLFLRDHPKPIVDTELVYEYLTVKTGVPMGELGDHEQDTIMNLEERISERVIGQVEAIKSVSQALRKARSGIGNRSRPIGSFLFMGPTGVGKTELAKVLTRVYFQGKGKMVRFDMSEFQNPNAPELLIGSAQTNTPGRLTSHVLDTPYGVLLLDEFEKAHPSVYDLFLQILDEGSVTDAFGNSVSFRNLIIIATSNAGSDLIKQYFESGNTDIEMIKKQVIDALTQKGTFRVEFLNRFDDIIFFHPLTYAEAEQVAKILLDEVVEQVKREKNVVITYDASLPSRLARDGYNPMFGARSLRRHIQQTVEAQIADQILGGRIRSGGAMYLQ